MYFCKLSYLVSLLENGLSFVSDTPPAGDIFEQHWEFCSVFGSNEMLSMRPTRKWITRANSVNDSLEMCSVCSTTAADIKVEDCQDLCRRAQQLGPNKLRPTASVFCHFLVSKKNQEQKLRKAGFYCVFVCCNETRKVFGKLLQSQWRRKVVIVFAPYVIMHLQCEWTLHFNDSHLLSLLAHFSLGFKPVQWHMAVCIQGTMAQCQ